VTQQRSRVDEALTESPANWDSALHELDGHLLQSWQWGEFKSRHGWQVERVAVSGTSERGMAQILTRHRGPVGMGYIPRGPAISPGADMVAIKLFSTIDEVCKRRRCLSVMIEPDKRLPFDGSFKKHGFVRGSEHFQPSRTVIVPLLEDEPLLGQMHQKTRYSIRLAYRRGIEIRRAETTDESVEAFHRLLRETSERNEFGIHSAQYYGDFLKMYGDSAVLFFAMTGENIAASLIAARFGRLAVYMYGASSTAHRAHGAAFALQFEAMRWARDHGCTMYDLWGIPDEDPSSTQGDRDRVAATRGDDWRGLYKFKVGFGGEIVRYPPTLERRYRPFLAYVARQTYANRGG
jgi:lipid II:glycine glycyltransferase (peptidoglycan interpeptide bridge formation enzyme)